jgi:hypothetical protein
MRLVRYGAATAGLIAAVLASGAPAALADDSPVSVFPNPSAPGTSTTFQVNCSSSTAAGPATSATLEGTILGLASQIPMQATAQTNEFVTTVVLPTSIAPGTYSPDIDCSNGVSASATLTVNVVPTPAPPTGDGTTSTATNTALTEAGLALLGAGALVGGLVLHKRRSRSRT